MAEIFPFRGFIPRQDITNQVVSKPFDKYTMSEVETIVRKTPFSFLHVIKPELASGIRNNPEMPGELNKSRKKFVEFTQAGILQQSAEPSFYIYRQIKPDFTYTGVVATISASDYRNGNIRIHEQTLSRKEEKLKEYLKVVEINAEPVMFTYPHAEKIDELIGRLTLAPPYADFTMDGKQHQFWCISQAGDVAAIKESFKAIQHVYVADGHHRSASSVLLQEELSAKSPGSDGQEPWQNFLGIFFPDHNLQLFEFNRLLKTSDGLSAEEILNKLQADFDIVKLDAGMFKPQAEHQFSMYLNGIWYALDLKVRQGDSANQLDADLLNAFILEPVFGVKDMRNDPRIEYLPGPLGPEEMKRRADAGNAAVAFGLFPVSFEKFFKFSDEGRMMPPKTTWFEPKLLNALVVYDLEINK